MQEPLEILGCNKLLINCSLTAFGKFGAVANGFNTLLNPGFLGRILNMHKFNTNGGTIGLTHDFQNFIQCRCFKAQHMINKNRAVHIFISKTITGGIQFWMDFFFL